MPLGIVTISDLHARCNSSIQTRQGPTDQIVSDLSIVLAWQIGCGLTMTAAHRLLTVRMEATVDRGLRWVLIKKIRG